MMQTQIPSGLQALMQASQVLQQESTPVVQTPMGPKPTVAAQVNQGLEQVVAQKAAPFMQAPNVREMGQQAGLAGQLIAQQQARQQQMAQNPQAIAQLAAQMMQQRMAPQAGIDALPSNIQGMADGGIVMFNGEEDGSYVSTEEELKRSPYGRGLEEVIKDLRAEREATERQNRLDFLQQAGVPVRAEAPPAAAPQISERARLMGMGIDVDRRPSDALYVPRRTTPQAAPEAPQARPPASARPAAPQAGIASALPMQAPTMADVVRGAETIAPSKDTEDYIAARRRIAEAREKAIAGMPDLEAEGIAAIERSARERQELMSKKAERDAYNKTLAFFKDLQTRGGSSYETVQKGIEARAEEDRLAKLNEAQATLKLRQAQQARKLGEFDRADALEKEAMDARQKLQNNRVQAANITQNLVTGNFSTMMQYDANMKRIAADQAMKSRELAMREKELASSKDGQMLNTANSRVVEAMKAYEAVGEKKEFAMVATMPKDIIEKTPGMKEKYQEFLAEKAKVWSNAVEPAIRNRDRLEQKVFGSAPATGARPAPMPTGSQSEIMKQLKTGTVYQTARGPAKWDGTQFVPQ